MERDSDAQGTENLPFPRAGRWDRWAPASTAAPQARGAGGGDAGPPRRYLRQREAREPWSRWLIESQCPCPPAPEWCAARGRSAVRRAQPTCGSRGAPVAVVIAVGVAHGERQAGLALRVLLVTLSRGTVLEEVRDVADLEKTKETEGLGTSPAAELQPVATWQSTRLRRGHSR